AGAHTLLASILQERGDQAGAAAERAAALEINRTNTGLQTARFSTNSGIRMLAAGDLEGAIGQFRSAIQAAPQYAPAHFELALALERKGDRAGAFQEYRQASRLDPRITPPIQ